MSLLSSPWPHLTDAATSSFVGHMSVNGTPRGTDGSVSLCCLNSVHLPPLFTSYPPHLFCRTGDLMKSQLTVDNPLHPWRLLVFCVHCKFFFIGVSKMLPQWRSQHWTGLTNNKSGKFVARKKKKRSWSRLSSDFLRELGVDLLYFQRPSVFICRGISCQPRLTGKCELINAVHLSSSCKHGGNFMYEITCLSCC